VQRTTGRFRVIGDRATKHRYAILDQAGIAAFQRWRFKPEAVKAVKIPLRFSMHHGIRHRMAGAVIAD